MGACDVRGGGTAGLPSACRRYAVRWPRGRVHVSFVPSRRRGGRGGRVSLGIRSPARDKPRDARAGRLMEASSLSRPEPPPAPRPRRRVGLFRELCRLLCRCRAAASAFTLYRLRYCEGALLSEHRHVTGARGVARRGAGGRGAWRCARSDAATSVRELDELEGGAERAEHCAVCSQAERSRHIARGKESRLERKQRQVTWG